MRCKVVGVSALLLTIGLQCQTGNTGESTIRLRVTDTAGAVIPSANVFTRRVEGNNNEFRLAGHTNPSGVFEAALAEGGYDVIVTSPGFASELRQVGVTDRPGRLLVWKLKPLPCDLPSVNCDTIQ